MRNTESIPKLLRAIALSEDAKGKTDVIFNVAADMIETSMCWIPARIEDIDDDAFYIVKTDGREWRDLDIFVMHGFMVRHDLNLNHHTRGRPVCVAKITTPPKSCLPTKNSTAT